MPDLSFVHASPFYEFTALLVLAAAIGFIGQLLRQPLIVAFITVGVMAGPSALGIVRSKDSIGLLAKLGIALLPFHDAADRVLDRLRGFPHAAMGAPGVNEDSIKI